MLSANDCRNALALINRASIQGAEVEEVARLKKELLAHAQQLDSPDKPHQPTLKEVRELDQP